MVHTATSLALAAQGQPTKKQHSLKAGLRKFADRGDAAVKKELPNFIRCPVFPLEMRRLSLVKNDGTP
jgi:hypothetical protein